jgi:hypothetical protein
MCFVSKNKACMKGLGSIIDSMKSLDFLLFRKDALHCCLTRRNWGIPDANPRKISPLLDGLHERHANEDRELLAHQESRV